MSFFLLFVRFGDFLDRNHWKPFESDYPKSFERNMCNCSCGISLGSGLHILSSCLPITKGKLNKSDFYFKIT